MQKLKYITFILTGVVAVIFFVWLTNNYVLNSEAVTEKVSITISPKSGTKPESSMSFIFSPEKEDQKISGVDLVLEVENGTLDNWGSCQEITKTGSFAQFTELKNETGKTARYSCVVLKKADELPHNVLLDGNITCNGSEPVKVKISEKTKVSGPVEGSEYLVPSNLQVEYSCDGSTTDRFGEEDMLALYHPRICTGQVGDSCDYDFAIMDKPTDGVHTISGVYVKMKYDPKILKYTGVNSPKQPDGIIVEAGPSFTPQALQVLNTPAPAAPIACSTTQDCVLAMCGGNTNACPVVCNAATNQCVSAAAATSPQPTIPSTISPTIVNQPTVSITPTGFPSITPTAGPTRPPRTFEDDCELVTESDKDGILELMYTCDTQASNLKPFFMRNLGFDAIADGSGELTIESIQVVGAEKAPYTVKKRKASYNIGSGSADGNVELDLKLRMQCVVSKPKAQQTMKVRIGLGDGPLKNPVYKETTLTVDDSGHWNGSVSFNVPAGSGYKLLAKGEKHMQKKICTSNPTEGYPGAYSCDKGAITLKEGKNTIDLSKIVLLSGDIPPGDQDGISNAKDMALVRNLLGKRDKESAELADINYDGVINAVDHSCVIAALAVHWDEE